MKILIPIIFLCSCTSTFRGTLVDIEEFTIGMKEPVRGEKIIKEIITDDGDKNAP